MNSLMLILLMAGAASASILFNGDFEKGLDGWSTNHTWYEKPKGAGQSEITVPDGEGRDGSKALKIVGGGKRGLAMQVKPAYPGRYRVAGWIKCEGVERGKAGVLAEWMGREHKWLRGDWAVQVSGTQDWQHFEAVMEPAAGTRSMHFDLVVGEPTNGTVWFDNLEFVRLPSDLPPPSPPTVSAETPAGREGCLEVSWDPERLAEGTVRILVLCEKQPLVDAKDLVPRAVADSEAGRAMVWSLENGQTYHLAAIAVNADDAVSAMGPSSTATVADRQAPRPGWIEARRAAGTKLVGVSWSPHVLDPDVRAVHLCAPGEDEGQMRELKALEVTGVRRDPRPLYCIEPWVHAELELPEDANKVGVWCEDAQGNRGEVGWAEIAAPPADTEAPCAVWLTPPTEQLPVDAQAPAELPRSFELELMRGQAKGFQVMVRPEADLHRARVTLGPLAHEDGRSHIDPRWLAYHFVNYVELEKNSRATPEDELLWPGPAEYPDELSDDPWRDLPAGRLQPIYVRVTAPRGAKAGLYRGHGRVESEQGWTDFEFTVRVAPMELPERPRLKFVYWFSWGDTCKEFEVEQYSEDGWRVLARLGELMRTHHQNVAVVPWSMVRTWRTPDGNLIHDFRDFDRFVRTFQEQQVDSLFCLSHIGSRKPGGWTCPTMGSHSHRVRRTDTGVEDRVDVLEVLPAIERHIDELGLIDSFSVHVADEPIPQNVESYRELAAKVKAAAPRLRRIDAIHVPDLEGALEIWVPQLNYFEKWLDEFRKAQAAGNEVWFYIAWVPQGHHPNRMIDSQAIKSRVLHWLNAMYDTTGYLHWALNHWHISLMSLQSPGDQYICWPSQRFIANSSLRYEAEREGLEDCELMFMLRDALEKGGQSKAEAQESINAIARKAVRGFQDYTRSWQEMEQVRHELIEALARAGE